MTENPPYIAQPGIITRALERIEKAATPERFTQDFLETVLKMKGGNARQIIPFFKKIGLLRSDGTPTDLYLQFRNPAKSKAAIAQALRSGYRALFETNEYAHELTDEDLKGLIVEVTGLDNGDAVVGLIANCFKKLRERASFRDSTEADPTPVVSSTSNTTPVVTAHSSHQRDLGLNLSYTINLNLPATSNIEVFNAIFKSLKETLLSNA